MLSLSTSEEYIVLPEPKIISSKEVHHLGTVFTGYTLECLVCGKHFYRSASRLEYGSGRYCSRTCVGKSKALFHSGENHHHYGRKRTDEERKRISEGNRKRKGEIRTIRCLIPCETCGKNIERTRAQLISKPRKYCSIKCTHAGRVGENHPNWKGGEIKCVCQFCGKDFYEKPCRVADGRGRFCSKSCLGKSKTGERNPFYGKQSKSGPDSPVWNSVEETCRNCGKLFYVQQNVIDAGRGFYCSKECFIEYHRGAKHHCWKGGASFEPYPPEFNSKLKQTIRQRDNHSCQICGIAEEDEDAMLTVHHIDYDKGNLEPSNLITICKSCHGKTNWQRDEWQAILIAVAEGGGKP